jgi:hypothetical protein
MAERCGFLINETANYFSKAVNSAAATGLFTSTILVATGSRDVDGLSVFGAIADIAGTSGGRPLVTQLGLAGSGPLVVLSRRGHLASACRFSGIELETDMRAL